MTEDVVDEQPRCTRRCLRVDRHGICDRCYELSRRDLEALPALYVELAVRLAPGSGSSGNTPVSGSKERPLGLREDPFDQMALMVSQLGQWAHVVSDERGLAGPLARTLRRPRRFVAFPRGTVQVDERPDRDPDATRVVILAEWLATHHEWASRQTWSDDYSEEVRDLAHGARSLAGLYEPMPTRVPGVACPRCEDIALIRRPKEAHDDPAKVECASCGSIYLPDDERLQHALQEAAHQAKTLNADDGGLRRLVS